MARIRQIALIIKWLLNIIVCATGLWSVAVAIDWQTGVWAMIRLFFGLALVTSLFNRKTLTERQRALMNLLLIAAFTLIVRDGFAVVAYSITVVVMALISQILRDRSRDSLVNLGMVVASLVIMLLVLEAVSPAITTAIADMQRQNAIQRALAEATPPLDQSQLSGEARSPVTQQSPQAEFITQGPGPEWGELTGWGTNTDSVLCYQMEGVYDVMVEYNRLGFRGPEISYEKPDAVYRILLLGDSFIEAREVDYEDTVYAQLDALLDETVDGKRIEVFGVGATGWGTLQEYLYYHHEGYKFSPDLIINLFVINDVADNNPAQFYPDRKLDFVVDDHQVQLLVNGIAPTNKAARSPVIRWLDALPPFIGERALIGLIRRVIDPPRESVTLAGDLTRIHPQTYIFVREPEITGYLEGWRRTRHAYEIWADEARANGTQLMVLAVDISVERITELSTYFADQQEGWVWDVDLPYKRLQDILIPLDVPLIWTRDRYETYARERDQRPFDLLFYVEDGHWNPTGHRVTAELLADTLVEMGVVEESSP